MPYAIVRHVYHYEQGRPAAQIHSSTGIIRSVSQTDHSALEQLAALEDEERAWLQQQLADYKELLAFLHDH